MSNDKMIRTLQVVTTRAGFFEQQVQVLEQNGISCTVVSVPKARGERSILDYLRFQSQVLRKTIQTDFDLVQANYGLTAPAVVAQPRRPIVVWLWGTELVGRYSRLNRACAVAADAVIVMSNRMADRFDRPCYVIRHGVDTELFSPMAREKAQSAVGWDPDEKHVLFPWDPSRPIKNYPRARAVVDAVDDHLDQEVTLQVVQNVPPREMPVYVNATDALILTSEMEGSPNAVREALSCNVPVVSVDVGDVRERISGVENCHVCTSDEELVSGLISVLRSGERSNGRERIDEFSLERMATDLLTVYEDVLDDFQAPRATRRVPQP